jgi:two-component system cell cycle response regulator CpdR
MSRIVLLVDDDPLVLQITADMLDDLGCEVMTARDGEEALEKIVSDRRIEILITDINMPKMDGTDLAKAAVRIRKKLKVIVLSGREIDGCGFPLIQKPFSQQELKRTMARHTGLC